MWGLLERLQGMGYRVGAIPTCVGTTGLGPGRGVVLTGHPHVCGDYEAALGQFSELRRAIPTWC